MPLSTVAEADAVLGYVDAWTALDEPAKERALSSANLWLVAKYVLPVAPTLEQLDRLKLAEMTVARYGLVTPLFPAPGTDAQGAVTKLKRKVDVIETETTWAAPEKRDASGPVTIAEVDALLMGIATPRGPAQSAAPLPAIFVV